MHATCQAGLVSFLSNMLFNPNDSTLEKGIIIASVIVISSMKQSLTQKTSVTRTS